MDNRSQWISRYANRRRERWLYLSIWVSPSSWQSDPGHFPNWAMPWLLLSFLLDRNSLCQRKSFSPLTIILPNRRHYNQLICIALLLSRFFWDNVLLFLSHCYEIGSTRETLRRVDSLIIFEKPWRPQEGKHQTTSRLKTTTMLLHGLHGCRSVQHSNMPSQVHGFRSTV